MNTPFDDMLRGFRSGFADTLAGAKAWAGMGEGDADAGPLSTLLRPVDPYNRWPLLSPVIGAAGAAAMVALSGVALAAFVVMMAALAMIWFLLSEIFGFELALDPSVRF